MKYLLAITLMCLSQLTFAGSVYKCASPQGVIYQESPCKNVKTQKATCLGTGSVSFSKADGDCETRIRKEGEKKENEKKENALKRRDAFIKATTPKTYKADFDDCAFHIDHVASLADGKVVTLVDTSVLKMTKFCSAYGASIITCSKPDQKMIVRGSEGNGCN